MQPGNRAAQPEPHRQTKLFLDPAPTFLSCADQGSTRLLLHLRKRDQNAYAAAGDPFNPAVEAGIACKLLKHVHQGKLQHVLVADGMNILKTAVIIDFTE